ncbi:helix-turn-helix transcriptional regulator [uncultured Maribacter sp.]|uniref:helix-turn-helix transcriptional regulator n=1 Tax=uncultured Maribacter sp. TaxID=431308 RepID=UPI0030DAD6F2|tara:strand:+ start:426 stop:782 length:357 start_codon:yes stop_codon:yes gene_type:complete
MLDTTTFITRLKTILNHHELSSASFADLIDVQRSSISHLLNGRNKPSLEFIMKINDTFKEVDLQWLLYGEGEYPKKNLDKKSNECSNIKVVTRPIQKKEVERIVIFYTDGTFKNYEEQ